MAVRTFTTTPMYRATTSVLIEDERAASVAGFNAATNNEYISDPEPYYQTQLRILNGRELATKVVARLNLAAVPEFNGQGPQRTGLASVLDTMKRQAQGAIARVTGGAPPMLPSARATRRRRRARQQFPRRGLVDPVRGSRLYNVSVQSADPVFAAQAADVLVEEYVKQNFERRTEATARACSSSPTKSRNSRRRSKPASARWRSIAKRTTRCRSKTGRTRLSPASTQVNDQYTRTRTERIQKEAMYNQIRSLPPAAAGRFARGELERDGQTLRTRMAELQRQKVQLNERYGPKHPQVIENENAIADTNKQYQAALVAAVAAIRNEYETALAQERRFGEALEAVERRGDGSEPQERRATRCSSAKRRATGRFTTR